MKICKCGNEVEYKNSAMCKTCHNAYTRQHYLNNKNKYLEKAKRNGNVTKAINRNIVIDYLRSHPCVDCGNNDIEVLQFDHISDKIRAVSTMLNHNTDKLLAEIAKCEIRCANCHAKKTRRQLGHWTDGH